MIRLGGSNESQLPREQLERILRDACAGIAVVSPHPDGVKLEYTNDAFFSIFGYTRDEYEELGLEIRLNLFNAEDFMDIISRINTVYSPGSIQEFECRINKKGGEQAWVLIRTRKPFDAGTDDQTFVCSFTDITDLKNLQTQVQSEKKKYEIVEELSESILFNYDVVNDVFESSSKMLRSLGTKTRYENAIENFTYGNVIDHRDVPEFIAALSNGLSGKKINVFDARIINNRGEGIWHRIKFSVVSDSKGNPVNFIGTLSDIDKEKKEKTRLIVQAQTDQLTGFFNKISTSLKISEIIKEQPDENGAMFLIDLDDFKELNDTYGHREGDVFLKEFTAKLNLFFRSTDVLGRVGGEEFVIYVNGVGDTTHLIEEKAEQIEKICHSILLPGADNREFSCSIGIARYPQDGKNYTELYERADKAMYSVKHNGKNDFAFYKITEMD